MKFNKFAKIGAALAAAGVLALGGAATANATTTAGHVDLVAFESGGTVGTELPGGFEAWKLSGTDNEFVFTNPTSGDIVTCDAGVYTIPENNGAAVPTIGFTNHSSGPQDISLTADGDYVEFIGDNGYSLISDAGPAAFPVAHEHGDWVLQKDGSSTCDTSETFELSVTAGGKTQPFTFELNL